MIDDFHIMDTVSPLKTLRPIRLVEQTIEDVKTNEGPVAIEVLSPFDARFIQKPLAI